MILGLAAAVAWAAIPDSGTGQITACYGKSGNLHVIDAEACATCPKNETALTWNQTGPPGAPGSPGVSVVKAYVTVPLTTRHDIAGTSTPGVGGRLTWVPLSDQTATLNITDTDRLVISWWSATTCFGVNRKYVRVLVDGTQVGGAPLTSPVGHISDFPPVAIEASVTVRAVAAVGPGTQVVTVETAIDTGASCSVGPASGGGGHCSRSKSSIELRVGA